jgi:CheY-like chemotaxis protein
MPREEPASILVVEDNKADADLVVDELMEAAAGVTVEVIGDGRAALKYLRDGHGRNGARRPDLVLLDLNLPGLGGFETLAELKSDDQLRSVPVVVLTTSKSQREVNRGYELGAAAVLNKPMRLADYRELLRAVACLWLEHAMLPRDP